MCLAIPGKVVKIEKETATVDYGSEKREAMIAELGIEVGDYVLVQGGFVVQKIPEEDAIKSIEVWKEAQQKS